MAEDEQGSTPSQGDNPGGLIRSVERLTDKLNDLLPKIEQMSGNPGPGVELVISEFKTVGSEISGAIKLLDATMNQVGTAVRDTSTRTENVQTSLNRLQWAIWPSLIGIAGTIVSIWLRKPSP